LNLKPPLVVRLQPARAPPLPAIVHQQQPQPQLKLKLKLKHPRVVHLQLMRVTERHPPAVPM
jgi:hypothetical protein